VLLTPAPARETEFGELLALLVIVAMPLALPVTLGANTTFICAVCPAAIVAPASPPVTLKPAPVTLTCATVMLEFPVFFTATPSELDPPTTSLPKFRLVVESEMDRVAVPPLPLSARVYVGFVASLFIAMLPVTLPETLGENETVKLLVAATASVKGKVNPLIWKPVPVMEALDIVKLAPPEFFSCTVCEFVVPVAMLPKPTLDGVELIVPAFTPLPLTEYCTLLFEALLVNRM
jgi:hypothetical protein